MPQGSGMFLDGTRLRRWSEGPAISGVIRVRLAGAGDASEGACSSRWDTV